MLLPNTEYLGWRPQKWPTHGIPQHLALLQLGGNNNWGKRPITISASNSWLTFLVRGPHKRGQPDLTKLISSNQAKLICQSPELCHIRPPTPLTARPCCRPHIQRGAFPHTHYSSERKLERNLISATDRYRCFPLNQCNHKEINFSEFSNSHNHVDFSPHTHILFWFYPTILRHFIQENLYSKQAFKYFTISLTEV